MMVCGQEISSGRELAAHYRAVRERVWPARLQMLALPPPAQEPAAPDSLVALPVEADLDSKIAASLRLVDQTIPAGTQSFEMVRLIQISVARCFSSTRSELIGRSRLGHIIQPRQLAMTLARQKTQRSHHWIARQFGGRDHSTICHAVSKWTPLIARIRADMGAADAAD
jgi:hypothetical protein